MTKYAQAAMEESVIKVESVFIPGRLRDKRDKMLRLQESGDTMFFNGEVAWSVLLTNYDKKINGESESLDAAFRDMISCLGFLENDHEEDTEVICAAVPVPENRGKK